MVEAVKSGERIWVAGSMLFSGSSDARFDNFFIGDCVGSRSTTGEFATSASDPFGSLELP